MRKIRKIFSVSIALIVVLTACGLDFDGSRRGNQDELIMEYKVFNKVDSQDLVVEAGDNIHVEVVVKNGQLSLKIQKGDDLPVYENVDITSSDEFDVEIEESGTYTVTVIGKRTKGSVNITVESD